jgi:hypothetical protein
LTGASRMNANWVIFRAYISSYTAKLVQTYAPSVAHEPQIRSNGVEPLALRKWDLWVLIWQPETAGRHALISDFAQIRIPWQATDLVRKRMLD